MKTIQPVQEMTSFFGLSSKLNAGKKTEAYKWAISLVSAFLIILLAAWFLDFVQKSLSGSASALNATIKNQEPVAFLPSRVISEKTAEGYLRP